ILVAAVAAVAEGYHGGARRFRTYAVERIAVPFGLTSLLIFSLQLLWAPPAMQAEAVKTASDEGRAQAASALHDAQVARAELRRTQSFFFTDQQCNELLTITR